MGAVVVEEVTTGELGRSLQRIEAKLDQVTGDHEQRLRRVERWMWTAMGLAAAGAASGLASVVAALNG